jgi:2-polyprenyl-3-methyl-5-hydroxy-6-metoxy-1,4-benzoquinol methylase
MGIKTSVAALLVRAWEQGATFSRTATIGRQSLTVPLADLTELARRCGAPAPDEGFAADGYCEDFLCRFLRAEQVVSFDASEYQSVSVAHDFNRPLPEDYAESFDAVIDGGTMEHIFDVRQVLQNYMGMPKVGGSLFICTNANNLCGHGFYQFSPEFFYRVFCEANGYRVETLCLIETPLHIVERSARQRVFEAADPAEVGKRTVIVTDKPISIYVHARRTTLRPLFATPPVQSDYAARWLDDGADEAAPATPPANGQRRFAYISTWETLRRGARQRRKNSLRNRKWFKPLTP